MEKIMKWAARPNGFYTKITGERCTNSEVVLSNVGLVVFLLVTFGLVGVIESLP